MLVEPLSSNLFSHQVTLSGYLSDDDDDDDDDDGDLLKQQQLKNAFMFHAKCMVQLWHLYLSNKLPSPWERALL